MENLYLMLYTFLINYSPTGYLCFPLVNLQVTAYPFQTTHLKKSITKYTPAHPMQREVCFPSFSPSILPSFLPSSNKCWLPKSLLHSMKMSIHKMCSVFSVVVLTSKIQVLPRQCVTMSVNNTVYSLSFFFEFLFLL